MNKIIFPIILILSAIGIFMTFTQSHYDIVKELRAKNAEYKLVFADAKKLLASRDALVLNLNTIQSRDKARIAKLIPDSIDNVRLIVDINDGITSQYNVAIKNIRFEKSQEDKNAQSTQSSAGSVVKVGVKDAPNVVSGEDYNSVTLNFSITASYGNFLKILRDLESSLRIVDITSISFKSTDVGDVYQYDIGIKTNWLK